MKNALRFTVLLLICWCSSLARGATGDVLACVIDKTGTYAHVKLSALSAGGSYNFGTLPASPTVTFTVTSLAYDNAGNATTTNRTVLGRINAGMPNSGSVSASTVPIGPITGGPFVWGETVTQTGTLKTATVTIGTEGSPLIINNVQAGSNSSGAWVGGTSGASATPTATPSAYSGFPAWEGADGSDLWVRVVFSEPIYSGDTSIQLNTSAGWYTGATATTNFACTNHSTLAYPACICRWVSVPGQKFSGSLTLEVFAVQHFATGGHPCACVVLTASDGTNTVTQTATSMTLSTSTNPNSLFSTASSVSTLVTGETMTQAATNATCVVLGRSLSNKVVYVTSITGTPDGTHNWTGGTSGAVIAPNEIPYTANKLSVYAFTINASSFNQSATVTCNFTAYPWIGDSSATYTTVGKTAWASDNTAPTGPIPFFADKGNSYPQTVAFVDPTSTINTNSAVAGLIQDEVLSQVPAGGTATAVFNYSVAGSPNQVFVTEITGTPDAAKAWTGQTSLVSITPTGTPTANGNNATGAATDISNVNPNNPATWPARFAQDASAVVAIAAYNNTNHALNTANNGVVYFMKGRSKPQNANSGKTASNVYVTYTRAPGTAIDDVRWIGNGVTTQSFTGIVRFYDMDLYLGPTGNGWFVATAGSPSAAWFDSNRIQGNNLGNGMSYNGFTSIFTNNLIGGVSVRWNATGGTSVVSLCRQNVCINAVGASYPFGNTWSGTTNNTGMTGSLVAAYNRYYQQNCTGNAGVVIESASNVAFVGNLIEQIGGTQPAMTLDDDSNGGANIVYWHNTIVGERNNSLYNWTATADLKNLSVKYWSSGFWFTKHDRGPAPNNVTYNKGWQAAYGVGFLNGNQTGDPSTVPASYFYKEPIGFTSNTASNFVNNKGQNTYDSQGQGGGNGDYHPASNSVLRGKVTDPVIPFDLAGTAISVGGSAGALQPVPVPSGNNHIGIDLGIGISSAANSDIWGKVGFDPFAQQNRVWRNFRTIPRNTTTRSGLKTTRAVTN